MSKRFNVEKKIENAPFSAIIGTVNRTKPASFYISGKMYITPTEDLLDYSSSIKRLKTDLNGILRRFTASSSILNKEYISNLEVAKNGIKYGKNSYLFFQFFFSQKSVDDLYKGIDEIRNILSPSILSMLNEFGEHLSERGLKICEKAGC